MSFSLPERVTLKGPNFIREVFERGVGVPGFISFGIGNPAPEAIPVKVIEDAFDFIVHENPMGLLQYGPMQGDARLAELTLQRLSKVHHMNLEGQGLIISNGAGQLLGLVPITVCEPGDEVYMDDYTFTSAINSVRNMGAKAVGIKTDEFGMIPSELEKVAQSGKGKYIYLIPNFQNPTGITMPLERRKEIYAIASKYDLFIYEDDPYGEIRFAGEHVPTFKSFDTENSVLYAGSYSKTLSAGLRVGFLLGPEDVIGTIQALKNNTAGQMPLVTQKVVAHVLDHIDYDVHLENVRKVYKSKIEFINVITAPEIEMLIIIHKGMYSDYYKVKSHTNPSDFCKDRLKLSSVKSKEFIEDYFADIDDLLSAIKKYKRLANIPKNEVCLADLLAE